MTDEQTPMTQAPSHISITMKEYERLLGENSELKEREFKIKRSIRRLKNSLKYLIDPSHEEPLNQVIEYFESLYK